MKTTIKTALKKTEKYTKTDMIYLTKNSSWLSLTQLFVTVSSFILSIGFANLIVPEDYGTYRYVLSIVTLLTIISLPGLNTALKRAIANGFEGSLKNALYTKLRWGLAMMLVAAIVSGYYYTQQQHLVALLIACVIPFVMIIEATRMSGSFLVGKKQFKTRTILNSTSSLTTAITTLLVMYFTRDIFWTITAFFGVQALTRAINFLIVFKKIDDHTQVDASMTRYGKHLTITSILSKIATQIDKIIVFQFLGTAELAIYAFATLVPEQVKNWTKNLALLAFPKFAKQKRSTLQKTLLQKTALFSGVLVVLIVLYILSAPYIYRILFPEYIHAIHYSQIFAIGLLGVTNILPFTAMQAKQMTKHIYIMKTIGPVIQISLMIILLPIYGIWGIIWARVAFDISNTLLAHTLFFAKR